MVSGKNKELDYFNVQIAYENFLYYKYPSNEIDAVALPRNLRLNDLKKYCFLN